jgi:hypothetical protein
MTTEAPDNPLVPPHHLEQIQGMQHDRSNKHALRGTTLLLSNADDFAYSVRGSICLRHTDQVVQIQCVVVME